MVYFEDTSAADPGSWDREVLEISAAAASSLTVITDGTDDNGESNSRSQVFALGSYALSKGMQLRMPRAKIDNVTPTGGETDRVGRTIAFTAEIDTANSETQVLEHLVH